MTESLGGDAPLFLQIKRKIEDMIVDGSLQAGDQIPSSTRMVKFYQVNHLTVLKGINMLVDEGVIFKKRGVGMFVGDAAREHLLNRRRQRLATDYIRPLLRESRRLGVSREELISLITTTPREDEHDDD